MLFGLKSDSRRFWLVLSIVAAVLFSLSGLVPGFASPYVVQDDSRQHVFWLQQYSDPALFSSDAIAEYFKSVSPLGFKSLYQLVANLGIDVFWFNKILPLFLGVSTTVFCFEVSYLLFPVPVASFLGSVLLQQNLSLVDDLVSGTPRAFIYLLLLVFSYCLLQKKLVACCLSIIFQGLFYPQAVLITAVILGLRLVWGSGTKKLEFWGLCTAISILAIYALQTSDFAPVISVREARLLPEFQNLGRSAFFSESWVQFWLIGRRSGFFPVEWQYTLMSVYGLSLFSLRKYPHRFLLVKKLQPGVAILWQLFIASAILYVLAHLLLFHLHLPGRYTHHSLRLILALLNGLTLTIVGQKLGSCLKLFLPQNKKLQQVIKLCCFVVCLCGLLYPTYAAQSYPQRLGYVSGKAPELYSFLQQQPPSSLVATVSEEADFIPSLAQRSVLTAAEYSIPYHQGYYQPLRQKTQDLITAQYSSSPEVVTSFIQRYQPNFWLLDRDAFDIRYLAENLWLQQFSSTKEAIADLENHQTPFLARTLTQNSDRCIPWQNNDYLLLDTKCLVDWQSSNPIAKSY